MIIDKILSAPSLALLSESALRSMYGILNDVADNVEMSVEVFAKIGEIVDRKRTILRVRHAELMEDYPGFRLYVCPFLQRADSDRLMFEHNMPSVSWPTLRRLRRHAKHLRLNGMDDLLAGEWSAAFDMLLDLGGVDLCPGNGKHGATAIAYEWLAAGGDSATAAFLGEGGCAPLEELLMALHLRRGMVDDEHFHLLARLRDLYELETGIIVPDHKPILGKKIFDVESGIHVDGIRKYSGNYEPFPPGLVESLRTIRMGKHSGSGAVEMKLAEYGIDLDTKEKEELLRGVRAESRRFGRGLTEDEFFALIPCRAARVGEAQDTNS
jgi:homocitrate synthase NifV